MQNDTKSVISYLRSTEAIRERSRQLFEKCLSDQLSHFRCDLTQLDHVAHYVIQVIQNNYPDLQIPFHSRWRHFSAGGIDRVAQFQQSLKDISPLEQAKAKLDLAVISVLLDAGAGTAWKYAESQTGQIFQRSEGLAIASYHLFRQGGLSSDLNTPWQADAGGLQNFSLAQLSAGFQVSAQNPLVGLEGRVELVQQLGKALVAQPDLFGRTSPRPGGLVDYLLPQSKGKTLSAHTVFEVVLAGFSEIWPGRLPLYEVNLGDVWQHSGLPNDRLGGQLVPFHKLSQWLTYSLLEPLQDLGLEITELDRLTGLAEYRNGGLLIDLGLLHPKHELVLSTPHQPDSEVIVEWRALTIVLLDLLAERIRQMLHLSQAELPLAKVLEGGTWAAGRQIAAERRGGSPPIQVISDGTVF